MTQIATGADVPVIRLRSARDVLATVPRLLGYRPSESVVFLSLHEAGGVSTMRLDLPEGADTEQERAAATSIAGMLCRVPGVRSLVVVVYSDARIGSGARFSVPRRGFVESLLDRLGSSGFAVHDALCVAADGWTAYHGADGGVRHPLGELEAPAPGDPDEVPIADDVEALAALPRIGAIERRAFRAALEREFAGEAPMSEWMPGPVTSAAGLADAALGLDPEHPDHAALAQLLTVLLCSDERDVVLFTWAWGVERGEQLAAESDRLAAGLQPNDESLVLDLMGLGEAAVPDRERMAAAIAVVRRLAALAPESLRQVPLTALAWLHWGLGQASIAGLHVRAARALDPAYGLAELLETALLGGMLPEWAFRRSAR